jgi:hypothetical protein
VLQQTSHLYDFFLLCDNDSTIVDSAAIEKAALFFRNERTAIVQCRSVAVDSVDYTAFSRILSRAINVFHLFLTASSRYGWSIFIGHNAFLRTSAVLKAGGFTPGFFSDDLDLTVRVNLLGYRVAYAGEILIGEKHPSNYSAFRKRTYKWSYGCIQMLSTHSRTVLFSSKFTFAEKVSFFFFNGFYVSQAVLLAFVVLNYLFAPMVHGLPSASMLEQALVATIISVLVFIPTLVYFVKNRELGHALSAVVVCGIVYGGTDFVTTRGVWDALWRRKRRWVPTNTVKMPEFDWAALAEATFAAVVLLTLALTAPRLVYVPSTYLFVGKFLFAPAISILYRPPTTEMEAGAEDAAA